jgi:hypothetical protein
MTDIIVNEKYPDSLRIDHPDFGDVSRTTFAKGVITEFQQVADDPIEVLSMVKVEVGGLGESADYLPLFYHPKAQYWDGEDVLAQDFDEETGAFKQAWMSFRAGDEVVVMFKEGQPVAVVGFADGTPRIGENLIQFVVTSPSDSKSYRFFLCAKDEFGNVAQIYSSSEDPDGPDGLKLGITQEITPTITEVFSYAGYCWKKIVGPDYGVDPGEGSFPWSFQKHLLDCTVYHVEFVAPVGPIQYTFSFNITYLDDYYEASETYAGHDYPPLCAYSAVGGTIWCQDPTATLELTDSTPWEGAQSGPGHAVYPDTTDKVQACQYGESGGEIQNDFYDEWRWYFMGLVKDQNAIQVFVRPHNGL